MNTEKRDQKSILFILGDQLFPLNYIKSIKPTYVFMAEDYTLAGEIKNHKQKIMLFFCAMRQYAAHLEKNSFKVIYESLRPGKITDKIKSFAQKHKIELIHHFSIDDSYFRDQLETSLSGFNLIEHRSPKFLFCKTQFQAYLNSQKRPFMKTFYEFSRKELNILMDAHKKPIGGKYSYDTQNRKKIPKKEVIPQRGFGCKSIQVEQVRTLVENEFPTHLGDTDDFIWPTTRKEYLESIQDFVRFRLQKFGPYQDALSSRDPFLFHTLLSPGLNLGLITPQDILSEVTPLVNKHPEWIASIEGLVRQIIGWREFVKGIYDHYQQCMESNNHWGHHKKLKKCWWTGTTGLLPADQVIKKSIRYGYAHHIERLMIMANLFNLIGVDPKQAYRWFMEMYVDSADWVMQANVYGMGLMSDGGIFSTKPYICGSNYIKKMGEFEDGPWCDTLDGLYWNFIGRNKNQFIKYPRMSMMVHMYDKMDAKKLSKITKAAVQFVDATTY